MRGRTKILFFTLLPILYLGLLFFSGLRNGAIPTTDPYSAYQLDSWKKQRKKPISFRFEDVTKELGILHSNENYESLNIYMRNLKARGGSASVLAHDFDDDGFVDLFFTTQKDGKSNFLYRNINGKFFKDVTKEWGLDSDKNYPWAAKAAIFFDYDNDGKNDLFIAKKGCHSLFKNRGDHFVDVSMPTKVRGLCSDASGVNVFDYDGDGYLDIFITNFLPPGNLATSSSKEFFGTVSLTGNNREGGQDFLLRNNRGEFFTNVAESAQVADVGLGWAAGVSDMNLDGRPDIYIANDFGPDQLYLNKGNGMFENKTKSALGVLFSRNSMNVEFGDIDNNGTQDIYVTNVSRIGFRVGANYLWKSDGQGNFSNRSVNRRLDRCGWGWGAKFFDADRDGWLDLFSVTGFFSGKTNRPYWYIYTTLSSLPAFFRKNPAFHPYSGNFSMASNQSSCLFMSSAEGFFDVAEESGITDKLNGRGVAILDYDNNGTLDIAVANLDAPPIVYKNTVSNDFPWIGFKLEASTSNRNAYGSRVTLVTSGSTQTRELYPGNGFAGQSDDRIFFGLGKNKIESVSVTWPSGKTQIIPNPKLNRYQTIYEK
jgi:hypothetical protein